MLFDIFAISASHLNVTSYHMTEQRNLGLCILPWSKTKKKNQALKYHWAEIVTLFRFQCMAYMFWRKLAFWPIGPTEAEDLICQLSQESHVYRWKGKNHVVFRALWRLLPITVQLLGAVFFYVIQESSFGSRRGSASP